jgi:hypothetical protein
MLMQTLILGERRMDNCEHEPYDIPWGFEGNHFIELFDDRGDKIVEIHLCKKCHVVYWEGINGRLESEGS